MSSILVIDTSNNKKIKIGLIINGKKKIVTSDSKNLRSQTCLLLIDKILREKKLEPKDLSQIRINTGPGSFTGLRVGIAIANALSYLLQIPINRKKIGDLEEPVYN